ncbi:MAG: hypothetical protein RI894_1371 [Bacteroidota bacterium]|jgi:sucrose phosphorylase
MLNAYPDSIGKNLNDIVSMLKMPEFEQAFSLFYILPTFFNSDLDRGFSIIDYDINAELVAEEDLAALKKLDIQLKFDIVLNHLSVASPQFSDLIKNGDDSLFKDFFIDWNAFWQEHGSLNEENIVIPKKEFLDKLFMRKSGLPILNVQFPDGSERPYWNTFYQKVSMENGVRTYLGQMDVNAKSPLVWAFYDEVLAKVASYGGKILRLDAFAYLHKAVGEPNFFNKPGTWDYLAQINDLAKKHNLRLLPEIHAEYGIGLHRQVADKGYAVYDFFLPGLLIHTLEKGTNKALLAWANEIISKGLKTVNMLGCHDGIPVLDLKGLLDDTEIDEIIQLVLERGGRVKNLYGADGKKIAYYQVNATYYSALGESDKKMLLARAIQLFMPGTPQIWYLDLFAGKNDDEAADNAGADGHKEINRTTLSIETIKKRLNDAVVSKQLDLIRLRNTSKAFQGTAVFNEVAEDQLHITWTNGPEIVELKANLKTHEFSIENHF